ncbi:response regulator [Cohnella sp. JJ-181]|uniref:response regulator n=1 Tax=Cohnella rhizoplanae TaxID=2974897 RepID=UPI0022FF7339|nr:response regulator [Cohnella sp. JJ-181]CAI6081722.1 Protein-glutamate methylesterase/protein-glutamine glutaminase [Cohnella sp. JJ-181]
MNVILVDDEPVMHLIMRRMLAKFAEVRIAGVFTDTESAADCLLGGEEIGLAFVDISMPGENGLEFAARMENAGSRARIVFVTSHKEFALRAFELSAVDYLVKPVSQERLERTVHRALTAGAGKAAALPDAAERTARPISVTTLGDFSVGGDLGRVKWISNKSAELFAYLLMNRGKRIARSRLIEDIFGGMTPGNAEKYLNTAVYQLRKSLEPIGLREAVRSENDGYALELPGASVDYETFERRIAAWNGADGFDAEAALGAERLYTGDLFGNKSYVWATYETERLAKAYGAYVLLLAERLAETGETGTASKLLLKLHARDPLAETTIRHLMKLYAREGNKKALTAQYTDYVKLLNRELGIRPSKDLLLLYDSLVSGLADAGR